MHVLLSMLAPFHFDMFDFIRLDTCHPYEVWPIRGSLTMFDNRTFNFKEIESAPDSYDCCTDVFGTARSSHL